MFLIRLFISGVKFTPFLKCKKPNSNQVHKFCVIKWNSTWNASHSLNIHSEMCSILSRDEVFGFDSFYPSPVWRNNLQALHSFFNTIKHKVSLSMYALWCSPPPINVSVGFKYFHHTGHRSSFIFFSNTNRELLWLGLRWWQAKISILISPLNLN